MRLCRPAYNLAIDIMVETLQPGNKIKASEIFTVEGKLITIFTIIYIGI